MTIHMNRPDITLRQMQRVTPSCPDHAWLPARRAILAVPFLLWTREASASIATVVTDRQYFDFLGLFKTGSKPLALPRRQLNPNFSVLLLRSGYDAADDLDFVGMDRFQKEFWLLRQSRWELYMKESTRMIRQGDLSDPLYFDFIAAMQLETISQCMDLGLHSFQERCEVDEDPRTCQEGVRYVSRDDDIEDTARLRDAWEQKLGDKVYSGIREGFRGEKFLDTAITFHENTSKRELIDIIQTLLNVFVAQGFAVEATVSETSDGFTVKLLGPANLWAIEDVTRANSSPLPLYDVFAIEACLRQAGIAPVRCDVSSSIDKFCVEEKWMLA